MRSEYMIRWLSVSWTHILCNVYPVQGRAKMFLESMSRACSVYSLPEICGWHQFARGTGSGGTHFVVPLTLLSGGLLPELGLTIKINC